MRPKKQGEKALGTLNTLNTKNFALLVKNVPLRRWDWTHLAS